MSGLFSPGQQTNTATNNILLDPSQRTLINSAMPYLNKFSKDGITLPTGSSIAPFNPTQQAGQSQALQSAGVQNNLARQGAGTSSFLLDPAHLDPSGNPGLQGSINAATRPIFNNLTRSVLPSIRSEANMTGNLGASRQGIAEGMATQGAFDAAGDATSRIASDGYHANLNAMTGALGSLNGVQSAQNTGAATTSAVGDVNQQFQQQLLDELKAQFIQKQTLPLSIGKELLNTVGAIPSAGTTGSQTSPTPSLFQQILGGGLAAAGAVGKFV